MGKKTKKRPRISVSEEDRIYKVLINLKHKDLQRECILRGMEPKDVVEGDHHKLVSFFYRNFDNTQDQQKLIEFDSWRQDELTRQGYLKDGELISPALRFSYVGNIEKMDKPVDIKNTKKLVPKTKKPKAEVNETTGVRKGTKKAMTFDLAYNGTDLEETIKQVTAAFPGAEAKSIKIWHKRALKQQNQKSE